MISIVIPAYNEQDSIQDVIEKIHSTLRNSGISPYEIVVVDDGSIDQTQQTLTQSNVKVLSHLTNLGYGKSLKDGIVAAQYDTIVIMDSDGTYPVDKIPEFIKEYQRGFDMVIGARQGKYLDPSFIKRILRWFLKQIAEFTAGRKIPDINSGLRVFSKKTIMPFFPTLSNSFSFTTSVTLAYTLTFKVISFLPIEYNKRVGSTKVQLWRDILRTLQYITEVILYFNPLKIFLIFAIFLGGVTVVCWGVFLYGINPWCPSGYDLSFFFYLGGFFFLLSGMTFALGLISIQLKQVLHAILDRPVIQKRQ